MNRKTNPALIGAFVLGAIVIAGSAVLVFGGGALFQDKLDYVMYFSGSVNGLNVGSPVTFRGVRIGTVSDVRLDVSDEAGGIRIPVFVRLEPGSISRRDGRLSKAAARESLDQLVQKGLRGRLQMQSLITGQLMVQFDFYPDKPATFVHPEGSVPELPTIPSNMEELSRSIEKLPFQEILDNMLSALQGIENMANSEDVREAGKALNRSLQGMERMIERMNADLGPLLERIEEVSMEVKRLASNLNARVYPLAEAAQGTMEEARKLMSTAAKRIDELAPKLAETSTAATHTLEQAEETLALEQGPLADIAAELKQTLATTRAAMGQAERTLAQMQRATRVESPLRQDLARALREFAEATRSVRILAEFLEQHPEALLRGKVDPGNGD